MHDYPVLSNVDRVVLDQERRAITGLSRVTWWRLERQGKAPKAFKIGPRRNGWRLSSLLAFNERVIREGPPIVDYPKSEQHRSRQKKRRGGWPKGKPRGPRKPPASTAAAAE